MTPTPKTHQRTLKNCARDWSDAIMSSGITWVGCIKASKRSASPNPPFSYNYANPARAELGKMLKAPAQG
jgi:hypothetical protein